VFNLRSRVAPQGSTVSQYPPTRDDAASEDQEAESTSGSDESDYDGGASDDEDVDEEKLTGQCLFCPQKCDTSDENMAHMRKAHGFVVPYQNYLTVELETLVWFLQLVVYGYRECIACSIHRRTPEAVQHHMLAKGHLSPDLSSDIAEFYQDLPSETAQDGAWTDTDSSSRRLASGKILGHRSQPASSSRPRQVRQLAEQREGLPAASSASKEEASSLTALDRHDRKTQAITSQLARLGTNDQMSLAHLSTAEQRSVLAVRKKQLDKARRDERRARSKVERLGNKALMKHFKPDVPGRLNG
jgi:pre-60S factor REI1